MTPILTPSVPPLRDAFYELSLAPRAPDADLLDEMVRRYPHFAEELTDFAIELAIDALRGDASSDAAETAVDPSFVSPVVSRALSRFHNRLHDVRQRVPSAGNQVQVSAPVANPFAGLGRDEFRALARKIGGNTVFAAKLRDRQIVPTSIPERFRQIVAAELSVPLELVVAHFAAAGGAASTPQFLKSDDKPAEWQQQSFEDAVRSSGLSEEQQRRLLSL